MERKKSGKKFGKTSFDSVPPGPPPTHQTKKWSKRKAREHFPHPFSHDQNRIGRPGARPVTKDSRYTSVPTSSVTRKPTPDGPKKHTSRGHAPRSKQDETSERIERKKKKRKRKKERKKKSNEGGDPQWIVSQPLSLLSPLSFLLPPIPLFPCTPPHPICQASRAPAMLGPRSAEQR